ncbi:hypothetical protein LLH00_12270 [bacterium]|nr:hypothetical protein [bacterium]
MRKRENMSQERAAETDCAESLGFTRLLRLLRHLRRGGSRKGACGWANLSWAGLQAALADDSRLAAALERAENRAIACDEKQLDQHVQDGNRVALMFRMRSVYGYGNGKRAGKEARPTGETNSREFAEAAAGIHTLGETERRELAGQYRKAAGA